MVIASMLHSKGTTKVVTSQELENRITIVYEVEVSNRGHTTHKTLIVCMQFIIRPSAYQNGVKLGTHDQLTLTLHKSQLTHYCEQ